MIEACQHRRVRGRSWLGVDVGGRRKGFDLAVVDAHALLALRGGLARDAVIGLIERERPSVVAIDGPRACAPPGRRARDSERTLAKAICGIRWTPDASRVRANDYYAWVREGLALFDALLARGFAVIEVFPSASWTRWQGRRGAQSRSAWTRRGLQALELKEVPARTNQDQRDAIAAAVTARLHTLGMTETIGDIVVPAER